MGDPAQLLEKAPPGYVDLIIQDKDHLSSLLHSNAGTKDNIVQIRSWILSRAHSSQACCILLREHVTSLYYTLKTAAIQKMLYVIYALNDIFFHCSNASTRGTYTEIIYANFPALVVKKVDFIACVWPHMLSIMWLSYQASADDINSRERLLKIADMWVKKNIMNDTMKQELIIAMKNPSPATVPPTPVLLQPTWLPPQPPFFPPGQQLFQQPTAPPPPPLQPSQMAFHPPSLAPPSIPYQQQQLPSMQYQQYHPPGQPPPPPLPPPPLPPGAPPSENPVTPTLVKQLAVNLENCSVGSFANICKAALKKYGDAARYQPIDPQTLPTLPIQTVEPGRIEVRIQEFYRQYHLLKEEERRIALGENPEDVEHDLYGRGRSSSRSSRSSSRGRYGRSRRRRSTSTSSDRSHRGYRDRSQSRSYSRSRSRSRSRTRLRSRSGSRNRDRRGSRDGRRRRRRSRSSDSRGR